MSATLRDFTLADFDDLHGNIDGSETASLDDFSARLAVEDGMTSDGSCTGRRARIPGADSEGFATTDLCDDLPVSVMEAIGGELLTDEDVADWWRDIRLILEDMVVTTEAVTFILAGWQWNPVAREEIVWTPVAPAGAQNWVQVPSLPQTRIEEFG